MKFFLISIIIFTICIKSESYHVQVTGDRVSLRLTPSQNGELLGRAMKGEKFIGIKSTNGWQEVEAPEYIPAWVSSNYISNNIVTANKLNVRIGPNRNYGVLTVISKGDIVKQKEIFNDWIKIYPPTNSSIWITKDYTEIYKSQNTIKEEELEKVTENLSLDLDASMQQGIEARYLGFVKNSYAGLYEMVSLEGKQLCLIRGRKYQLEPLIDKNIVISGKEYYILSSVLPVIQPELIEILENE